MSSIFRKTALDKISSTDQLDQAVVITPPSFWLAMTGVALILVTAFIWSFLGRIPVNVNASGIYMTTDGISVLCAEKSGIVERVFVNDGDRVSKGDVIATFSSDEPNGEKTQIKCNRAGYLLGLYIEEGNSVVQGGVVCRIVADNVYALSKGTGVGAETDDETENEKQRVIFFDEATSALDNMTQDMVVKTLEKTEATKLVIAHRLSTVRRCDRIIVMNEGRIVEEGTYDELMEKAGFFRELAERQM